MTTFRTDHSASCFARACETLANGVSSGMRRNVTPVPLYIERADGPYLFDADGHRLLDYTLAWGPLIVGNNHPAINQAVARQLERGYAYGAQHAGEIELAEIMRDSVPGLEQVIFSNTGTEAVQAALRLARALTARRMVVKFEGHYHGWLNNVLVSYHPSESRPYTAQPSCGGQPATEFADTLVLPWNDLDALRRAFAEHPDKIAGVITEPILANSGSCMPADGFLQGVVDECKRHGAVSIFDEVITGFRIALGGARERFGVIPDLSVYGKAFAGGFSMSAVGGRRAVFDVLRDGRTIHAGTYNGNPITIAAAVATINILREPGTYDRMESHGQAIRGALERAAAGAGHTLATSGVGPIFSTHFGLTTPPRTYADVLRADGPKYNRFRALMLQHGITLLPEGRWYVGASHGDRELRIVEAAIDASLKELA